MDLNALKNAQKKLDERAGSDGFLTTKHLTAEGTVIRILPPSPLLNGIFHFEVIKYWIAGKPYICCSTFGSESVIAEELAIAKTNNDDDLIALATNTDSKTGVKRSPDYWVAVLQLEYKMNRNDQVTGFTVVDDTPKVLQAPSTLLSALVKVATSRKALTAAGGAEDGISDREHGSNVVISKVGVKLNTKYSAVLDDEMEMPIKWYAEIPDVYLLAKQQMKSKSYQRAIIRQYLYGEEIPKAVQDKETARVEALKAAGKPIITSTTTPTKTKKKAVTDDDEEEDETPIKKPSKSIPLPVPKTKKKVDDEDEASKPKKSASKKPPVDEDDEDEEQPLPKKKVGTKKPPVDDDDDDEPLPLPKKKLAPKKSVIDDDDEDEEAPAPKPKKKPPVDDDDEDEQPVSKKKASSVNAKVSKTILDNLNDDDEDEDLPKPKAKKKPPIEDDDDEDETPVPKKKAVTKKQVVSEEDVDDDDDF